MPFSARGGFFVSQGSAELWTPANTDTLLWLDGQDSANITESGGSVTDWTSKGNLSITVSQATASLQPTYNATANAVVFDGVDDRMTVANRFGLAANPDLLWCIVGRLDSNVGTVDRWGHIGGDTSAGTLSPTGGSQGFSWRHNNGYVAFGSTASYLGVDTLYVYGRLTGQNYINGDLFWRNGTSISSTASGSGTNSPSNTTANFTLGNGSSNNPIDGRIYEMVICESQDTDLRQKLEGYLAWRWGLEGNLPGGHPYAGGAPTV